MTLHLGRERKGTKGARVSNKLTFYNKRISGRGLTKCNQKQRDMIYDNNEGERQAKGKEHDEGLKKGGRADRSYSEIVLL